MMHAKKDFPEITAALICDVVRPETDNKMALLGVYGAFPQIQILVKDLNSPINPISLVFYSNGGEGIFDISLKIFKPNNELLLEISGGQKLDIPADKNTTFILGVEGLSFDSFGEYKVNLSLDDTPILESYFNVGQKSDVQ